MPSSAKTSDRSIHQKNRALEPVFAQVIDRKGRDNFHNSGRIAIDSSQLPMATADPPLFYPPRQNVALVRLCQLLAPGVAHSRYRFGIEVDHHSLTQLIALRQQRVLLLPNHPTFQDPMAMFLLSGKLGQAFYYLGAHEQFQTGFGGLFQVLGGYSIRRGLADRASIAQTLELLSQPGCHLVLFPEGGCSFQTDTVMPFRPGAVQMAFQAMAKQVRQGNPCPDLWVVPVSIRYAYTQSMQRPIQQSLAGLEAALGLPTPQPSGEFYARLRAIAEHRLDTLEQEYGIASTAAQDWNQRIRQLKTVVLQRCEQQYGLPVVNGERDRERVYKILNAVQAEDPPDLPEASPAAALWTAAQVEQAMVRLLNFDAIYDGYVAEKPTPERFLDTLIRLERDVFAIADPPPKGHRIATIRVGDPMNLAESWLAFQQNKTAVIDRLTSELRDRVQQPLTLGQRG
jgi:1-acyl-sn-glycerol-3-phosphate acyltransferase